MRTFTTKIAFSILLVAPSTTFACSCLPPPDTLRAAESADAVFIGRVSKMTSTKPDNGWFARTYRRLLMNADDDGYIAPMLIVEFTPERSFKGLKIDERIILTRLHGASCGYENFVRSGRFLIYADRDENQILTTNLCSRTTPVQPATQIELDVLARRYPGESTLE